VCASGWSTSSSSAVWRLLDALVVRKKWDAGIRGFFSGLKRLIAGSRREGISVGYDLALAERIRHALTEHCGRDRKADAAPVLPSRWKIFCGIGGTI